MHTITINLSDAQFKALSHVAMSPQDWAENAVYERCRNAIDQIVKSEIDRKLSAGEPIVGSKDEIVMAANIESAAERDARLMASQNTQGA